MNTRRPPKGRRPDSRNPGSRNPGPRNPGPRNPGPTVRRDAVRIPAEISQRIADGHPWVFADSLRGRTLPPQSMGKAVDLMDPAGAFMARAVAEPSGNPALRVFSRRAGAAFDAQHVRRRLEAALRRRRQSLDLAPDGCFRLLSGDSEGIPGVTVEIFGRHAVVCTYTPLADAWLQMLVQSLEALLAPAAIYLQRRHVPPASGKARPGAELLHGAAAAPEVLVSEGRCRFAVDVSAPASPGLFLDMRLGREAVARLAPGRRVLNCFSYTGAFSAVAALHGAREVVSVDSAARAHGRARRNFEINDLDPGDPCWEFITGDAFAVMARMAERKRRFELVILDPPTFSSTKGRTFTAIKDYAELVQSALDVLEPEGTLLACCNAAKLSAADHDRAVGRGAAAAGRRLAITRRLGLPVDFPVLPAFLEGDYLKILVAQAD